MATPDEINVKMGRGTVRSAGHAFGQQESGLHDRLEAAPYSPLANDSVATVNGEEWSVTNGCLFLGRSGLLEYQAQ